MRQINAVAVKYSCRTNISQLYIAHLAVMCIMTKYKHHKYDQSVNACELGSTPVIPHTPLSVRREVSSLLLGGVMMHEGKMHT